MRIIIIAALAASLSGAAWAGVDHEPRAYDCEILVGAEHGDPDSIGQAVDVAVESAMAALEGAEIDEAVMAQVEAEVEAAMAQVEFELASYERQHALSEAEEEAVEARLEAALERAEAAMERAAERMEEAHERTEAKVWRPRY